MSHLLRPAAPALACAMLASLALAACGGSGNGDPSSSSSEGNAADEGLQFSRCMRENGVTNFPNPESSAGTVRLRFKTGAKVNRQTMEKAQKACQKYAPEAKGAPNMTPAERVEHQEAAQRFAKCMREHGVELETRTANGGAGVEVHIGGVQGSGPNPESPAFKEAQQACQRLLPVPPGAGAGRPQAGGGAAKGRAGAGLSLSAGA